MDFSADDKIHFTSDAIERPRNPFSVHEVLLRHLQTPAEIADVGHLREGIDLSAYAADSNFSSLEKKETKLAWSSDLSTAPGPSVPFALSPWGLN